jgi:hypothetical protein
MHPRFLIPPLALVAALTLAIHAPRLEAGQQQGQRRPHAEKPNESEAQKQSPPEQARPRQGGTREQKAAPPPPEAQRQNPPEQAVPRTSERSRPEAGRRPPEPRRDPPVRREVPQRYRTEPRVYYFPPIDVRRGFYYHPYFGFYYGPYYGPFYPYPGPFAGRVRYSVSAIRTRVRPLETEVYVNGYYAGLADDFDGVFERLYLPAGEHVIDLRLNGYQSFRQFVYVAPGDTFEVKHQMLRLGPGEGSAPLPEPRVLPREWIGPPPNDEGGQPASPYGLLAIHVEPGDAQIVVDGEAWAAVQGLPELVVHLPAGWHELEVRKTGYRSFSTRLELHEGQTTRLSVTLER